jgi:hypothetical protein
MRTNACSSFSVVSTAFAIGIAAVELRRRMIPARRLVGHQLEVVGLAADHGAQRHQCVEAAALRHRLQGQRQFQRTGHGRIRDIAIGYAEARQFGQAAGTQALADVLVEAGLCHAHAQAATGQIGFEFADRHAVFSPAGVK